MGETISARDIGGVISEIEREFPGVRVTSADRTAQQNAAAGGARDSQHLHGRARDLDISAVPEDRRGALVERLKSLGVTGMGMYGPTSTSLHVDMREGPFTAFGPDRTRNSISQTPSYFQQVANTTNPQGPRATPPPASTVPNVANLPLSPAARSVLGMQMTNVGNQARNATEIAGVQQSQQQRLAEGERDASKSYAAEQRRLTQDLERRQQPIPEFIATRETARDIGSLASLLMVAGSMLGGKGKQGALMAVQSMTGMMAGYRQGRMDLYQRERQNYETGLRQVQAQNQQLQQAFERSQRTAQTDLEAARAEFRVAATALGANLPALMGQQMGYAGIGQALNTTATLVGQVDQADRTARAAAEIRRQTRDDANTTAERNFVRQQGDEAGEIYRLTGRAIPKESAQRLYGSARAMAEGAAIADQANRLPENMGRSGQLRAFIERYLTSSVDAVRNNRNPESADLTDAERRLPEGEQNALLFAKRYAAYLVNYERNLAGGARGFTVSFQNRFNSLMAQNQFSRQGFVDLMRQHVQELAQGSQLPGLPEFNFDRLATIGAQLHDQGSMAAERGSAARGFALLRGERRPGAAAPQAPDLSQFLGAPQ